jgi:hypothetical protein
MKTLGRISAAGLIAAALVFSLAFAQQAQAQRRGGGGGARGGGVHSGGMHGGGMHGGGMHRPTGPNVSFSNLPYDGRGPGGGHCGSFYGGGFLGGGGFGFGSPYAYGNGWWPYTLGHVPVPPYYSLHPPVYYSHPVPRTYGYSPYPYPGSVRTPEIEIAAAAEILNPHVDPQKQKKAKTKRAAIQTAAVPAMMTNPYVQRQLPAVSKLAQVESAP